MTSIPPPTGDDLYTVEVKTIHRVRHQVWAASHDDAEARYEQDGRIIPGIATSQKVTTWRHPPGAQEIPDDPEYQRALRAWNSRFRPVPEE